MDDFNTMELSQTELSDLEDKAYDHGYNDGYDEGKRDGAEISFDEYELVNLSALLEAVNNESILSPLNSGDWVLQIKLKTDFLLQQKIDERQRNLSPGTTLISQQANRSPKEMVKMIKDEFRFSKEDANVQ